MSRKMMASDVIPLLQKHWKKKHGQLISAWNQELIEWLANRILWIESKSPGVHGPTFGQFFANYVRESCLYPFGRNSVYMFRDYLRLALDRVGVIVDVVAPPRGARVLDRPIEIIDGRSSAELDRVRSLG